MQVPRPPAVGDQRVIKELRQVLFSEPIIGAVSARPKGLMKLSLAYLLGWWAPIVMRRATDPLPPTLVYLALTTVDLRLFSKSALATPYEIGRWRNGSYRASRRRSTSGFRVELELERLGTVVLFTSSNAEPVLDLVVQSSKT